MFRIHEDEFTVGAAVVVAANYLGKKRSTKAAQWAVHGSIVVVDQGFCEGHPERGSTGRCLVPAGSWSGSDGRWWVPDGRWWVSTGRWVGAHGPFLRVLGRRDDRVISCDDGPGCCGHGNVRRDRDHYRGYDCIGQGVLARVGIRPE